MNNARYQRISGPLQRMIWGAFIVGIDMQFGSGALQIDLINDIIGTWLIVRSLWAIAAEGTSEEEARWFGVAKASGVVSLIAQVLTLGSGMPSEAPALIAGGLGLTEDIGIVAFCLALGSMTTADGVTEVGRSWRGTAWGFGVLWCGAQTLTTLLRLGGAPATVNMSFEEGGVFLVLFIAVMYAPFVKFLFSVSRTRALAMGPPPCPCHQCGYNRGDVDDVAACPSCGAVGRCRACRYDLSGLTGDLCPECGRVVRSKRGDTDA